jgi:hypothetical protein
MMTACKKEEMKSTNILTSTEINMLKMGAFEYIIAC